jgi:SAM-dependent methyltransferase
LYARIGVGDEPDVIAGAVPAGAHILELGCGAGRMTRPLAERGFTVTAVDESPQMLALVPQARTVCSAIEDLDLGERFDVVLLASYLVHAAGPGVRQQLLDTCRRHVADGGCVLIQREREGRHEGLPGEPQPLGDGMVRVVSSDPVSPGVRSVHVEYTFPDASWTQTFLSCPLTPAQFDQALAGAGLAVDACLTEDGTWVRAVPV